MSKPKAEVVEMAVEADEGIAAAVAGRLAARLAEAKADWTALIREAATLNIFPPDEVVVDTADRLRLDQPKLRFRLAVEAFRSAIYCVHAAHGKVERAEELAKEIGPDRKPKSRIRKLETELAAAQKLLHKSDAMSLSVSIPVGQCLNVCREWESCFSLADVEDAAGKKLPQRARSRTR